MEVISTCLPVCVSFDVDHRLVESNRSPATPRLHALALMTMVDAALPCCVGERARHPNEGKITIRPLGLSRLEPDRSLSPSCQGVSLKPEARWFCCGVAQRALISGMASENLSPLARPD